MAILARQEGTIARVPGELHLDRPRLLTGVGRGGAGVGAVEIGAVHGALAMTTPGEASSATLAEVLALVSGSAARVQRWRRPGSGAAPKTAGHGASPTPAPPGRRHLMRARDRAMRTIRRPLQALDLIPAPATHATSAGTPRHWRRPRRPSGPARSPRGRPDIAAPPHSTPSWDRVSRITRNHCQASAETVSGINRSQTSASAGAIHQRGGPPGDRTQNPRIKRTHQTVLDGVR